MYAILWVLLTFMYHLNLEDDVIPIRETCILLLFTCMFCSRHMWPFYC